MKQILFHKLFWFFLGSVLIEQLLVASSTLWIAELSKAITENRNFWIWGILFVLSLSVVYLPSIAKNVLLGLSKIRSLELYLSNYITQLGNHPTLSRSVAFKKEREPFLKSESWLTIEEWFDFLASFVALLFNVVFNVVAFILLLGSYFGFAYLLVIPIFIVTNLVAKSKVRTSAEVVQNKRCNLNQLLGSGWNTILIGNSGQFKFWTQILTDRISQFTMGVKTNLLHLEVMTTISMLFSLIPVMGTIAIIAIQHHPRNGS